MIASAGLNMKVNPSPRIKNFTFGSACPWFASKLNGSRARAFEACFRFDNELAGVVTKRRAFISAGPAYPGKAVEATTQIISNAVWLIRTILVADRFKA